MYPNDGSGEDPVPPCTAEGGKNSSGSVQTEQAAGHIRPSLFPSTSSPSRESARTGHSSQPGDVTQQQRRMVNITVAPFTGGPFQVYVNRADTIEQLRKVIARRLKVSKDRIYLLYRESELVEGSVGTNLLVDGSTVTLLPRAETGLLSPKPEQSVMQALESLNEQQVNDFLSGAAPLNLTMRLGDHMMLIQLQLSTVNQVSASRRKPTIQISSSSPPLPTPPSTPPAPPTYPHKVRVPLLSPGGNYNTIPATPPASYHLVSPPQTCPNASSGPPSPKTSTNPPFASNMPVPSCSNTSSVLPGSNLQFVPPCTNLQSVPPSADIQQRSHIQSVPPWSKIPFVPPISNTESTLPTSNAQSSLPPHSNFQFSLPNSPVQSSFPNSSVPPSFLGSNFQSSLSSQNAHSTQQTSNFQAAPPSSNVQSSPPHLPTSDKPSTSSPPDTVCNPTKKERTSEPPAKKPKLDTKALAEASKNLTQTLKQLSSEVLTTKPDAAVPKPKKEERQKKRKSADRDSKGAIIESMHHHGKGVYSGTFSGTLNPALQDKNGQPKRDISTIVHILNDLLCAQYKAYNGSSSRSARHSHKDFNKASGSADANNDSFNSSKEDIDKQLLEEQLRITRSKVEQLRKVMEERRARRRARREARSAPYSTSWSVKSESKTSDCDTSDMAEEPEPGREYLQPEPEPVTA